MNGLDSDSDEHDVYATGHGGAGGRIRGETESTDHADSEGVSEAEAETDEHESEAHYGGSYESYGPEYSGSASGSAFAGPVPMSGFGSVSDIASSDVKDNLELSGDTSDTEELGNNRANNAADSIGSVSTAATGAVVASDSMTTTEAESGTEWTQDDAENQISSGISFDPTRGIVMTSVGEDGISSDVAIRLSILSALMALPQLIPVQMVRQRLLPRRSMDLILMLLLKGQMLTETARLLQVVLMVLQLSVSRRQLTEA